MKLIDILWTIVDEEARSEADFVGRRGSSGF